MPVRAIIDTNVIIDALANRAPFAEDAQTLLLAAEQGQFDACITSNTATDIFYILHRQFNDAQKVKALMDVLFDSLSIIAVDEADCKEAIHSKISDYEDAVLEHSAARNGVQYIVTRNTRDFKNAQCAVYTPKAFLENVKPS